MTLTRKPKDGLSHVMGDRNSPLLSLTIPQMLAQTVAQFGDREAVVFAEQGIRWNYRQFADAVDDLAGGLLQSGIAPGDRVGIWSPNRVEWLLTQFATARIGAILVCVNPAYQKTELAYALTKVGCKALVTARQFKASNYIEMLTALAPEIATGTPGALDLAALPELRDIIAMGPDTPPGMTGFDALCARGKEVPRARLDAITEGLDPDDAINIQFTSGTTGNPKGACLSHRNIVNNAHFVTATMRFTEADRLCIPVPFYHCFGMVMGTLGCVTKGAAMIVPGEGFDPAQTLRATADESCTALYGVPTMFVAELALPDFDSYDLSSLRTGIMAGAPCPIEVMKSVQRKMHMSEVTIAYGMTETSPVSFQSDVDDPLDKRVSSVGRVHPHVEVKIVGPDGAVLPTGTQGELLTRGYSVMKGYWGEPENTANAIDTDGWMHSGDLATMDAEGYCDITGRVKDMICRGGENIYPRELEEFLFTMPGVAHAQVFGIPDPKFGEIVCAWIVPQEGASVDAEAVRAYCKGNIAHFKIPAHVVLRPDMPMTVTGKPQKFIMRDMLLQELSHGAAQPA